MRALFLVLFFLLALSHWSYAQCSYSPIINYPDKATVERLVTHEHARTLPVLIYQPSLKSSQKVTTVLLIKRGATITYWRIRQDTLIDQGVLPGVTRLFAYSGLAQTGATKQEHSLKFSPPLMQWPETDRVIYADASRRFYFELGNWISGYVPEARRDRYRREWVAQIREAVGYLL